MRVWSISTLLTVVLLNSFTQISWAEEPPPFDDEKFLGKETPYLSQADWQSRLQTIREKCSPVIMRNKKINFELDETYERSRLERYVLTPADKLMSFTTKQVTNTNSCESLANSRAKDLKKLSEELLQPFSSNYKSFVDIVMSSKSSMKQKVDSVRSLTNESILRQSCVLKCVSKNLLTYWGTPNLEGYFKSHYLSNENRPKMSLVTGQGMCRHYTDMFDYLARNILAKNFPENIRPEFKYVSTESHAFVRVTQEFSEIDAYLDPQDADCNYYDVAAHSTSVAKRIKDLAKEGYQSAKQSVKEGAQSLKKSAKEEMSDIKDWVSDLLKPSQPTPKKSIPTIKQGAPATCTTTPQLPVYENACEKELKES